LRDGRKNAGGVRRKTEMNRDTTDGVEVGMEKQMLIGLEKAEKEVMAKDIGPTSLEVEMEKEKGKTEDVKETSLECLTWAKEEKEQENQWKKRYAINVEKRDILHTYAQKERGKGISWMDILEEKEVEKQRLGTVSNVAK